MIQLETAWYEFDMRCIRNRIDYLRSLLGENIDLAYAVKANTFIMKEMIPLVERFEICSPGESEICDRLGVPPEKTVISGVYKTPSFIDRIAAATDGRVYTVESLTQFQLLRSISEKHKKTLPVLLRHLFRFLLQTIITTMSMLPILQLHQPCFQLLQFLQFV